MSPFPDEAERSTCQDLVAAHDLAHEVFVADIGGDQAGAVVAMPGTLERLFVVPALWGDGVADALHAAASDVSHGADTAQCRLEVLEANRRARRFYERRGWIRDDRTRTADYPPHPLIVGAARPR